MELAATRYVVLGGKPPVCEAGRRLHDQAFHFWETVWPRLFTQNKASDSHLDPQQFWRQDIVACLLHDDRVIAQQCYSRYDLRSRAALAQPYLVEGYTAEFFATLAREGIVEVMTMEWLAVDEDWRQVRNNVSLGSAMLILGFMQQVLAGWPAVVTIARSDIPVARHLKRFGMIQVGPPRPMHNTPVAQLYCTASQRAGNGATQSFAQSMWAQRDDYRDGVRSEST